VASIICQALLTGLMRLVMGAKVRAAYPNLVAWYGALMKNAAFAVLGDAKALCPGDTDAWEVPPATAELFPAGPYTRPVFSPM